MMSAPTLERIGDFQPEVSPVEFDPTAKEAVTEALVIRRAIGGLASHPNDIDIPPTAIAEAQVAIDDVVSASFISHHKPVEPVEPPARIARALRIMDQRTIVMDTEGLEPTGGYVADVDLSTVDALWKPIDPAEIQAAKQPIELNSLTATVAKVALEEVAKQNLASIDDAETAAEVKEARFVLEDLFDEQVQELPPEKPVEPDLPFVIPESKRHRRGPGKLASLSLLLLLGRRR